MACPSRGRRSCRRSTRRILRADRSRDLHYADAALDAALAAADPRQEPLAAATYGFDLARLEFRMLLLGLAPELDLRFQRCIGFPLDEMSRRVGTFGLYSTLLGSTAQIRGELAQAGAFGRWPIFEGAPGRHTPADEPLRLDPFLAQWLLGQRERSSVTLACGECSDW